MNWQYFNPTFEAEVILNDLDSPWAGHRYFAYDLIANVQPKTIVELGTHRGTSFFAFCQAVKDQNLQCALFAIDSWKGDPHASFYGEEVYELVNEITKKFYSCLQPHLLRMNFDEAINRFEDNSIDLLHIDGYHTYEAVKHDFESWISKMSENGIILFHDTAEKRDDFGVFRFWDELKKKFKTIEFYHSHGLGVLLKNINAENPYPMFKDIWARYYSLYHEKNHLFETLNHRQIEIEALNKSIKSSSEEVLKLSFETAQKGKELVSLNSIINQKDFIISQLEVLLYEKEKVLLEYNNIVSEKEILIKSKDNDLIELTHSMHEKDNLIQEKENILQEKEGIIQEKDSILQEKESVIQEKEDQLSITENMIQALHNSYSWRITSPLRWVGKTLNKFNIKKGKSVNVKNVIVQTSYKIALIFTKYINHFSPSFSQYILKIFKSVKLIKDSELFDEDFYLLNYPEVRRSKINPILHYLVYGAKEGRNPSNTFNTNLYFENNPDVKYFGMNPLIHYLQICNKEIENRPESKMINNTLNPLIANRLLSDTEINSLSVKVCDEIENKNFVLAISHTDYLNSMGGVEIFMQDEKKGLAEKNVSYLQLSPIIKQRELVDQIENFILTFNVDSNNLGNYHSEDIIRMFSTLMAESEINCQCIVLHHLMSWNLDVIRQLIELLKPKKVVLWIHDFFSVCPQINLLRNDKIFCSAPETNSNSCLICRYGLIRKRNLPKIKDFFDDIIFTTMAPSQIALDLWGKQFPKNLIDSHIVPHLNLIPINSANKKSVSVKKLNVAFIGVPASHKGWQTWRKLVDRYEKSNEYVFFHMGNEGGKFQERFININVTQKNRDGMINALKTNNIDLLFHWAIWPETFSYTLYEGIAANCFIVTHSNSGNVAKYVHDYGSGIVFNDEQQLFVFMDDITRVRRELNGYLQRNSTPYQVQRNNDASIKYYF